MAGLYKSTYILAVTFYKEQLQTNKKKKQTKNQLTNQLLKHIQKIQTLKTVGNEM